MLEFIFQGFAEWCYGMVLECWEFFVSGILDIMSLDFDYLKTHVPIVNDIMEVMLAVGWALLLGNLVFQAIKSMVSGLGFDGEDPKLLFARTFAFSFLILASPQICELGLNLTSKIIALLGIPTAVDVHLVDNSVFGSLTAAWILVIICNLIIMFKIFKLILEIAERYMVLALLTMTAPLAFAMGGSRSTTEIFSGWCRMYGSMCLLSALNMVFFKMLLSVLSAVPSGLDVLPWMVLVFAIVKVAKKADGIVTRIGLNPAITGDGMGRSLPGMLTYAVVRTAAANVTKTVGKSIGGSGKGKSPNGPPSSGPKVGGPFGGGTAASNPTGNWHGSGGETGRRPGGAKLGGQDIPQGLSGVQVAYGQQQEPAPNQGTGIGSKVVPQPGEKAQAASPEVSAGKEMAQTGAARMQVAGSRQKQGTDSKAEKGKTADTRAWQKSAAHSGIEAKSGRMPGIAAGNGNVPRKEATGIGQGRREAARKNQLSQNAPRVRMVQQEHPQQPRKPMGQVDGTGRMDGPRKDLQHKSAVPPGVRRSPSYVRMTAIDASSSNRTGEPGLAGKRPAGTVVQMGDQKGGSGQMDRNIRFTRIVRQQEEGVVVGHGKAEKQAKPSRLPAEQRDVSAQTVSPGTAGTRSRPSSTSPDVRKTRFTHLEEKAADAKRSGHQPSTAGTEAPPVGQAPAQEHRHRRKEASAMQSATTVRQTSSTVRQERGERTQGAPAWSEMSAPVMQGRLPRMDRGTAPAKGKDGVAPGPAMSPQWKGQTSPPQNTRSKSPRDKRRRGHGR